MTSDDRVPVFSAKAVRVLRLGEALFAMPVLSQWFEDEWAPWYGPDGQGNAKADLMACCNEDGLPMAFVALGNAGQVLGTAALKAESLGSQFGHGPWLAAFLVGKPYRGKGVGSLLVAAIEAEARRLGLNAIYTSTDSAASLLSRRGWAPTGEEIQSLRGPVSIFRLDLRPTKP